MKGGASGRGPAVPRLHVVTNDRILERDDFLPVARRILERGGASVALHLRGPRSTGARLYTLAEALSAAGRGGGGGGMLVVNDRIDVALAVGPGGVQLPSHSLPAGVARALLGARTMIGVSIHEPGEGARASRDGADFLLLGTIFATPSHRGRNGGGTRLIGDARRETALPLVAIGGIGEDEVGPVMDAGAHGVAVIRGVWDAPDPEAALFSYVGALEDR